MIKMENGKLHIAGTRLDLTSELMCIMESMLKKEIITKEQLLSLTGLLCMPEEDFKKMLVDCIDNMDDIGAALELLRILS